MKIVLTNLFWYYRLRAFFIFMDFSKNSELTCSSPELDGRQSRIGLERRNSSFSSISSNSSFSSISSGEDISLQVAKDVQKYYHKYETTLPQCELSPRTKKMLKDGKIPRPKLQRQVAGEISEML